MNNWSMILKFCVVEVTDLGTMKEASLSFRRSPPIRIPNYSPESRIQSVNVSRSEEVAGGGHIFFVKESHFLFIFVLLSLTFSFSY